MGHAVVAELLVGDHDPNQSPQPQYQETPLYCGTTDWGRPPSGGHSYVSPFRSSVWYRDPLSLSVDYVVIVERVSSIFLLHNDTVVAALLVGDHDPNRHRSRSINEQKRGKI